MQLYAAGSKLRTDLSWGPFEAVFEIPPRADSRRVTASYKHGLLKVGLPPSLAQAVHLLWSQTLFQPVVSCAGAHLQDMIHSSSAVYLWLPCCKPTNNLYLCHIIALVCTQFEPEQCLCKIAT